MEMDNNLKKQIDEYIKKYCKKHECTEEEAKKHMMVRILSEYYKDEAERHKNDILPVNCGCGCLEDDRSC
ncbi:MAG: hypothetical protein ILP14_06915 [Oscillospiraceae bacterium]|nr:hypothetical protein [Oscillospiraceae bacterium]